MKTEENKLTLNLLYESRKKLLERISILDNAIKKHEEELNENDHKALDNLNNTFNFRQEILGIESDYEEIIKILQVTGRPLKMAEIKDYLDNNLGINFQQTGVVLRQLRNKHLVSCIKINNTKKLSYWVMSEWIDWETLELKRAYKKFGITKNFSIKTIEVF